jgi:O-6-methylguanine DNA methyltransferase
VTSIIAQRIYSVVQAIPLGRVATYKQIALLAGVKNPRVVGNALHHNPDESTIPCHRVVNAAGRLAPEFAFGGTREQAHRLMEEGVMVVKDKVDLNQFQWQPDTK